MHAVSLFGTDGLRGEVPRELDADLAMAVGNAMVAVLAARRATGEGTVSPPSVLIGRDTRVSGPALEAAVVAGITAAGGSAWVTGVMPTPAVAALVPRLGADAGLVISASHNPPQYNGIKLLDRDGRKWDPAEEAEVERRVQAKSRRPIPWDQVGEVQQLADGGRPYREELVRQFLGRVPRVHAVVDLGYGAASATVPDVLERLGLRVTVLNGQACGIRINQGVGATHPEVVAEAVTRLRADIGFTFDGDADRVMASDEAGHVVDGDGILYILATGMHAGGRLPHGLVVGTVMANLGLERALDAAGLRLLRTPVGDRWVANAMADTGARLGGEQSGHIILSDWAVTGDGLLTALAVLAEMEQSGQPLSRLMSGFQRYPQVLQNVELPAAGFEWEKLPGVGPALDTCRQELAGDGRLVVRASGTEPLLRIMIEGRDEAVVLSWADRLTAVVRQALASGSAWSNRMP